MKKLIRGDKIKGRPETFLRKPAVGRAGGRLHYFSFSRIFYKRASSCLLLLISPWVSREIAEGFMLEYAYIENTRTAKAQHRKFETNIPKKGTARLQSPIPTVMFL
jgi:hypothetical protein